MPAPASNDCQPAALTSVKPGLPPMAYEPHQKVIRPEPAAPRVNLAHIGIVGNRNSWQSELEQEFPMFRFTLIDSHKRMVSLQNCARVLCMIKWVGHAIFGKAKKMAGERYVSVDGGLSDLKRVLSGYATGELSHAA